MERLASWSWRRFGVRYFKLYAAFEVVSAFLIVTGTLGLLTLYEKVSSAQYWRTVLFACACVAVSLAIGTWKFARRARPLFAWAQGHGDAPEAWRTAISLPVEFVTRLAFLPVVLVALPVSVFITIELDLPAYSVAILFGAALVAVAYAAVLHFFGS